MTHRRRRFDNAHGHDRNRFLSKLLAVSSNCHWCRRPIVRVKDLKRQKLEIVLDSHFDVTWRTADGTSSTCSKATLDHIVPLGRGGPRTRENVVAACARCNHRRNAAEHPKTADPKDWRTRHPIPDDERELGEAGW